MIDYVGRINLLRTAIDLFKRYPIEIKLTNFWMDEIGEIKENDANKNSAVQKECFKLLNELYTLIENS